MQVFHCVVAMDEGTFMNACMSSLEVCWGGGGWGWGCSYNISSRLPPHVWVIPRCRDMPRQVPHCSRATALGGVVQLHPNPPIQTLPDKGQRWQEELMTTCQAALDSHFGGQIIHLNSVTWME